MASHRQLEKRIKTAYNKYLLALNDLEESIRDKVLFEFCIERQESDGLMILCPETSDVAPLSHCLNHIKKNESLSFEDFKENYSI